MSFATAVFLRFFHTIGFGRKISWQDDVVLPAGHQITFKDALHVVTTDIFLKLIVPDRALGLTKRLNNVRVAFNELQVRLLVFWFMCS
jgi:hypothetical protein